MPESSIRITSGFDCYKKALYFLWTELENKGKGRLFWSDEYKHMYVLFEGNDYASNHYDEYPKVTADYLTENCREVPVCGMDFVNILGEEYPLTAYDK